MHGGPAGTPVFINRFSTRLGDSPMALRTGNAVTCEPYGIHLTRATAAFKLHFSGRCHNLERSGLRTSTTTPPSHCISSPSAPTGIQYVSVTIMSSSTCDQRSCVLLQLLPAMTVCSILIYPLAASLLLLSLTAEMKVPSSSVHS
ncbi:hypothetical protein BD310DRAFT_641904 [Dichomitus squalens]|uniref:Uncharacterized protein n=1 Tax=Dichomitus squalens TaxID=114155 RepID=A0A4Q9PP01_9APHY|nr:hypothetical protein BD310DRAFT_641904 [Dichomitus squalens]